MSDFNVICVKWGKKCPADDVNRLHSMVQQPLHVRRRFVCLTDDAIGLGSGIKPKRFFHPEQSLAWSKLNLYTSPLPELSGRTLSFDVDVVIANDMDELVRNELPKRMKSTCGSQRPYHFTSSAVQYEIGRWSQVLDNFLSLRKQGVAKPSTNVWGRGASRTPAYVDARPGPWPTNYRKPGYYCSNA